jgi:hypothetical protein
VRRKRRHSVPACLLSNGFGDYPEDRHTTLQLYDALPPAVRRAVAAAVTDWAIGPFTNWLRSGREAEREIIEYIREDDAQRLRKSNPRLNDERGPMTISVE